MASSSEPDQLMVGRYLLEEQIGTDGDAEIYRAKDLQLDRDVALQIAATTNDPSLREAFRHQAQVALGLEHPCIVELYDYEEVEGRSFLVMELVGGPSLKGVLEKQRVLRVGSEMVILQDRKTLPLDMALAITEEILSALDCAHGKGIIHGDLGMDRVMLTQEGHAKVMGFGRFRDGEQISSSRASYLAPEVLAGQDASAASDLCSVGALLYRMLIGSPPPGGRQAGQASTPPSVLQPGLPWELDAIVKRALAVDPVERYPSAAQMRRDVAAARSALDGEMDIKAMVREGLRGHQGLSSPIRAPLRRLVARRGAYSAIGGLLLLGVILVTGSAARRLDSEAANAVSAARSSVLALKASALPATSPLSPSRPTAQATGTSRGGSTVAPTTEPAQAQSSSPGRSSAGRPAATQLPEGGTTASPRSSSIADHPAQANDSRPVLPAATPTSPPSRGVVAARPSPTPTPPSPPQFVLGFKKLAEMLGGIAGRPLENEHPDPATGNEIQRTTTGLMVWRKSDKVVAFTNGSRTWLNGPNGLEVRSNTVRLPWEARQ